MTGKVRCHTFETRMMKDLGATVQSASPQSLGKLWNNSLGSHFQEYNRQKRGNGNSQNSLIKGKLCLAKPITSYDKMIVLQSPEKGVSSGCHLP